jgi:hypothetical protein
MLASNVANVAVGVVLAANEMVGRLGTANIANLTAANVRTIINVEDGAQACNAVRVAAAGAVMESDFAANGDMMVSVANTAAILGIGANGQVLKVVALAPAWATDLGAIAFPETANGATMANIATPALGQGCFRIDELAAYVCTVIA